MVGHAMTRRMAEPADGVNGTDDVTLVSGEIFAAHAAFLMWPTAGSMAAHLGMQEAVA